VKLRVDGRTGAFRLAGGGNALLSGDWPWPCAQTNRIDLRLDDLARVGEQHDLGFVARPHLVQLVLVEERDDGVVVLDPGDRGNIGSGRSPNPAATAG